MPRPVFDYVEGGADEEISLARNRQAYERFDFVPSGPADVSAVTTAVDLLGRSIALPLICSPTGYSRMMHPDGERPLRSDLFPSSTAWLSSS